MDFRWMAIDRGLRSDRALTPLPFRHCRASFKLKGALCIYQKRHQGLSTPVDCFPGKYNFSL